MAPVISSKVIEIPGFDYEQFYLRISENLPEWVSLSRYSYRSAQYGYLLTKGKKEDQTAKELKIGKYTIRCLALRYFNPVDNGLNINSV